MLRQGLYKYTKILKYIKGNIGAGSKIFKGERNIISRLNLLLQRSKIFFVAKKNI